jgi:rod shape determining protein RodA
MNLSKAITKWFFEIDWVMMIPVYLIVCFGLFTMNSFVGENPFFNKQLVWLGVSSTVFIVCSLIDFKFLRRTNVVVWLYVITVFLLVVLSSIGAVFSGAQSWFNFGAFAFQPAELAKLVLVITMAKYFSRRHIEIKNFRHLIVSGVYAFILCMLIFVQPDFGSALIIFFVWFGMVMVSGLSKKHLIALALLGAATFAVLWSFVLADYQKARVMNFLNPTQDIRGTGYNAYQSMITVGSGQLIGKGLGYGTQSRLSFLPEYQTDFIFAAYAEEWGFVGVILLFTLYAIVIWCILANSLRGASNFESLFGIGVAILFMSHFIVHVGMNIGLMPITGLTLPFMSYGGTNLLISFIALGVIMSMKRYSRITHRDLSRNELVGF